MKSPIKHSRGFASARILIIDPESAGRDHLQQQLKAEGFHVLTGNSGRDAIDVASRQTPDLVILNTQLPDTQAYEVCRLIRENPQARAIPILTVSNRDAEGLGARCLNSGADSHVANTISRSELIANVRALLRRPKIYISDLEVVQKGRMTLRLAERRVLLDGRDISYLTPKEYELIKELILCSPRIVKRGGLVLKVWGIPLEELGRKTLDVHIQRLRSKLGPTGASFLRTVSLVGYQWLEPART